MEEVISKEEFDELMDMEGKGKGVLFKTASRFVEHEKGKEGLSKLKKVMRNLGYPLDEIISMYLYPVGLYVAMLLAIQRLFDFKEEDFVEMGRFESRISLIVRLFTKFFSSVDRAVNQAPKVWRAYFSFGKITVTKMDKESFAIFRVDDFILHPLHCRVLEGYFPSVVQMVLGSEVSCKETKCMHEGDDYHEFLLEW